MHKYSAQGLGLDGGMTALIQKNISFVSIGARVDAFHYCLCKSFVSILILFVELYSYFLLNYCSVPWLAFIYKNTATNGVSSDS